MHVVVVDVIEQPLTIQFNHVVRMSFGVQRMGLVSLFSTGVMMLRTVLMDRMNKTVHVRTSIAESTVYSTDMALVVHHYN